MTFKNLHCIGHVSYNISIYSLDDMFSKTSKFLQPTKMLGSKSQNPLAFACNATLNFEPCRHVSKLSDTEDTEITELILKIIFFLSFIMGQDIFYAYVYENYISLLAIFYYLLYISLLWLNILYI